jgi:tellurite resistance protein
MARKYLSMTQARLAAYMHDRADELFDAIITAAAMVARADGRIDPVERSALLGFLNRNGFLAVFTRGEVLDAFEDRTRQLAERCGAEVALGGLRRFAGRSLARLVVNAGTHVAGADGRLHPGELRTLALIRFALGIHGQSRPSTLSPSQLADKWTRADVPWNRLP